MLLCCGSKIVPPAGVCSTFVCRSVDLGQWQQILSMLQEQLCVMGSCLLHHCLTPLGSSWTPASPASLVSWCDSSQVCAAIAIISCHVSPRQALLRVDLRQQPAAPHLAILKLKRPRAPLEFNPALGFMPAGDGGGPGSMQGGALSPAATMTSMPYWMLKEVRVIVPCGVCLVQGALNAASFIISLCPLVHAG